MRRPAAAAARRARGRTQRCARAPHLCEEREREGLQQLVFKNGHAARARAVAAAGRGRVGRRDGGRRGRARGGSGGGPDPAEQRAPARRLRARPALAAGASAGALLARRERPFVRDLRLRAALGAAQRGEGARARRDGAEDVGDEALGRRRVHVAHDVQVRRVGLVVRAVEGAHVRRVPAGNLLLAPDREAVGEGVVGVELAQVHGGAAVVDRVDHLQLRQDRLALLLDPRAEQLGLKRDLAQRVERERHQRAASRVGERAVEVVDGVVEVGVRVRLGARREEPLALPRAHEGHMLDEVREALLVVRLLARANVQLEVGLEAADRGGVGQDRVAQPVPQLAAEHARVLEQRRLEAKRGRRARRGGRRRRLARDREPQVAVGPARGRRGGRLLHAHPRRAKPAAGHGAQHARACPACQQEGQHKRPWYQHRGP